MPTTVPGAFAPVSIDGRLLVDGGIVDNLPVDLTRDLGADVVIAVDVGTPLADREKLRSVFAILGQTTTFLTRKNSDASLAAADLVITPDLSGITSADFPATAEAISRGRSAALAAREVLTCYALDDESWSACGIARSPPRRVDAIRVEGNQRVDARLIMGRMHVNQGNPLDVGELRKDLGSTIPVYDEFTLGGLFALGGYAEGEFRGQYYATGKVGYHFRIAALPAGFGQGIYVGALLEGGNTWDRSADISLDDLRYGFTAILGADTILGPAFFAWGLGEGGADRFYLTVGRTF